MNKLLSIQITFHDHLQLQALLHGQMHSLSGDGHLAYIRCSLPGVKTSFREQTLSEGDAGAGAGR